MFLAGSFYEPTDLVERGRNKNSPFQDRTMRLRQESAAGYKDQVLEEVFRFPPRPDTLRKNIERINTRNVVKNWMKQQTYPNENNSVIDRAERRPSRYHGNRSVASDPVLGTNVGLPVANEGNGDIIPHERDEELMTHDEATPQPIKRHITGSDRSSNGALSINMNGSLNSAMHNTSLPNPTKFYKSTRSNKPYKPTKPAQQKLHNRNLSKNTIIYNPISDSESIPFSPKAKPVPLKMSAKTSGTVTPGSGLDRKTPKSSFHPKSYPRPIIQTRNMASNIDSNLTRTRQMRQRRLSLEMGTSQIGLDPGMLGAVPNSFATQMAMATGALKNAMDNKNDDGMMGRLMLARMKTLEEGFAEIVKEFRVMRTTASSPSEDAENMKKRR